MIQSFSKAGGQISLTSFLSWVATEVQHIYPSTLAMMASIINVGIHALLILLNLPKGEPAHTGGTCAHSQISMESCGERGMEDHKPVKSHVLHQKLDYNNEGITTLLKHLRMPEIKL